MDAAALIPKMIAYSQGDLHDIEHFLKVYAYARTIGSGEGRSKKEAEQAAAKAAVGKLENKRL